MGRAYLLLALTALSCADMTASTPQPAQLERVDLQMREVPVGDRRMNVTADVPLTVVDTIVHHFLSRMSADVFGVWAIPGEPDHYIVFGEQPMKNSVYGPQVFVVCHGFGTVDVIHETARMMDADFLDPAFFRHRARLLMLADFGSEDSWGLVALHLAPNAVQDLGIVDVVRPGTFDFTESALPAVAVFVERGRYVLKVRGEVIESPTDAPTKSLAVKGQRAVFRQTIGRFVFTGTE